MKLRKLTFDPCVCTALRKASRAVTRIYDDALAAHDMTTPQFAILRHLSPDRDLPLSRLAELLVMDRTSLYRAIAPIERRGWIEIHAAGPRVKQARLTLAGSQARAKATLSWELVQAEVIEAISPSAWAALEPQLASLTASVSTQ